MDRVQPPIDILVGHGRARLRHRRQSDLAARVAQDLQGSVCSQIRRHHIQPFGSIAVLIGHFEHFLIE